LHALRRGLVAAAAVLIFAGMSWHNPHAQAQSAKPFFQGKKVNIIIGYAPGGSYGLYPRLLARHFGAFIPGNPVFLPKNMPGAGSLVAANYLYNVAPRDGTVLGAIGQSVYLMQQLKRPKINYDAKQFNWIGRFTDVISLILTWHSSKVKTIEDAKKYPSTIAVGGTLSGSTLYVAFINKFLGTKFQLIKGYGPAATYLAVERGEVDGTSRTSMATLFATHPDWVKENKIQIVVQVAPEPSPRFPNAPGIMSLIKNERDRAMMEAVVGPNAVGRPLMAPPGIPSERVALLRSAFMQAVNSPRFKQDAKKSGLKMNPLSGEKLHEIFMTAPNLSPDMVAEMNKIVATKYRSVKKSKKKKKN
jgi:tripartite-type tricarboxylate transporter receptor subunit TctC